MIRLSRHAADMLAARAIDPEWVIVAVQRPDLRVADPADPMLTRSFRAVPEAGGKVLRVVHRRNGDDMLVVTAFFDRGARS